MKNNRKIKREVFLDRARKKKAFARNFANVLSMSDEDLAYEVGDALFDLNIWLEALSYRRGRVEVFITAEDSSTAAEWLNGGDDDFTLCDVQIEIKCNASHWLCDKTGTEEF